ncbi:hypothetical protein GCM10009605_17630 [Nocardiopsis composta]
MTRHHYEARCERDGRAWSVDVPELRIHTFGATLADAEEMARDAIALVLEVPMDQVSVSLEVVGASGALHEFTQAREASEKAESRLRRAQQEAVDALLETGASQRDAARLLGLSHQRVSQVARKSGARAKRSGSFTPRDRPKESA